LKNTKDAFILYYQIKKARANKEVIVSGGAINSPQLLMLSGIGDADELKHHGIPIVCHLPGVGKNHQDHLSVHLHQVGLIIKHDLPLFSKLRALER